MPQAALPLLGRQSRLSRRHELERGVDKRALVIETRREGHCASPATPASKEEWPRLVHAGDIEAERMNLADITQ